MNGILDKLKKLIRNKSIVTILTGVVCFGILYYAYQKRVDSLTNPVSVPFALEKIPARTEILESMVGSVKIPASMLNDNIVKSRSSIVGKYVNYNTFIPDGSLFYSSVLVTWEDMPDSAWSNIPDEETIVSLSVNASTTYGNSIFPGDKIDLYYKAFDEDGKLVLGKLIEGIQVIAVKDDNGKHIFKKGPDQVEAKALIFSVSEKLHLLLRKAIFLDNGEIIPVPRNMVYTDQVNISSTYLANFILSQTKNIEEDTDKTSTDENGTQNNEDITIE